MKKLTKKILIPVDGSQISLKSLDYLDRIYGANHELEVDLFYVLPALPPILTDERSMDQKLYARLSAVNKKNREVGERILAEAKKVLLDKGFQEEKIKTAYQKAGITIAQDICNRAISIKADSVLITRRGRTDLETFFMGGISNRLIENRPDCPVWVIGGGVTSNKVLVCIDSSDNALKAVDHAGFMLAQTDCEVTIFHTMRHLTRFVPREVISEAPELEKLWSEKSGQQIAPYLQKSREMLLAAGLKEEQLVTKVIDGTRSPADDILKEAQKGDFGTIVMGKRGLSGMKRIFMGSVTNKILHNASGFAVWIV